MIESEQVENAMSSAEIACPRCNETVDPQARECPHCGVDLALAAVLAERDLTWGLTISPGLPMSPEVLVPRLGEYLVERGVLSNDDLQAALRHHLGLAADGKPRRIGQVLLDLGLVDRETLDQIVTEQILKLQDALQQANQRLEQRVKERTLELQRALTKLSELNQLKSNFISNISHELRTPLTHLRGYLTLMSDGSLGELSDVQQDACHVMTRAEMRLEKLIDDLIQFSLATRGELTLSLAPVSVADLIGNVLSRSSRLAATRKVQVHTVLAENLPLVKVDGEKISWVLLQLLDNALKFTPADGHVTIESSLDNGLVRVCVRDTGIGIAANQLSEIFEPFHQLDGSDTRRYGGVGLGLTLVRQILDAHGIPIHVTSEPGQGSCFEFSLPAVVNEHE
jgi:signal transduction histidine kinase